MPEMHLKQSGFTHSTSGFFTENKENRIKTFKEKGDFRYINRNKLNKACF